MNVLSVGTLISRSSNAPITLGNLHKLNEGFFVCVGQQCNCFLFEILVNWRMTTILINSMLGGFYA